MYLDIITCLPDYIRAICSQSIFRRSEVRGTAYVQVHNLRDYAVNKHGQIDDAVYGGDAGMLLMAEPIVRCIEYLQSQRSYDEVIYLAPDGEKLTQSLANELALYKNIILVCGHYKGIDERVRDRWITREISIGRYVISGGELAAMVLADSVIRLIPGTLSDETSALTDSFQDGLVAPPAYTRPASFRGMDVPSVLLSGDPKAIKLWQQIESERRTRQ